MRSPTQGVLANLVQLGAGQCGPLQQHGVRDDEHPDVVEPAAVLEPGVVEEVRRDRLRKRQREFCDRSRCGRASPANLPRR